MKEEGGKGQPSPPLSADGRLPARPAFSGLGAAMSHSLHAASQPPTSGNNTVCAEVPKPCCHPPHGKPSFGGVARMHPI